MLSVISLIVFGRIGLIISAFLGVTLLVFRNAQEKIVPANLNTLSLILVAIALGTPIALVIKYPVFIRKMVALMTAAASTLAQR